MSTLNILFLIFIGGGAGSISRYGVGAIAVRYYKGDFPIGTLLANFLACLILGILVYSFKDKIVQNDWIKYLLLVGFCGGFSTFSTFSLETLKLMNEQHLSLALINILVSLVLGIGILFVLAKV